MERLKNKTAVITGGTTGIGFATAKQFLEEGARVIVMGQNEERLAAAAKELGPNAIPVRADVRSLADLDALAARVNEEFGGLDILFANAGVGYFAYLEAIDEVFYDNQFDVNVKGVFFTVQRLISPFNIIIAQAVIMTTGAMISSIVLVIASFAIPWPSSHVWARRHVFSYQQTRQTGQRLAISGMDMNRLLQQLPGSPCLHQ